MKERVRKVTKKEEGQRDLARGCVHARANECKRGWWIWAGEAGWQPRHTTREATRAFPMPGTTSLSLPPSFSFPLTFSLVLLQSVRRAHLHFSVVPSAAEKQFSVHMSPTSVIVRFFSLSRTISVVSHKKRNRKFMTASGSFAPLIFLLFLYYILDGLILKWLYLAKELCRIFHTMVFIF